MGIEKSMKSRRWWTSWLAATCLAVVGAAAQGANGPMAAPGAGNPTMQTAPAQAGSGLSDGVVKIGVMTDLSGTYSDNVGKGSVVASQLAIDEFGGKVLGVPIELVSADHLNKVDVGAEQARRWLDRDHVDVITELGNSAVAIAVTNIASAKNRMTMVTGAGATRLSNEDCKATNVQWAYSTYALAKVSTTPLVRRGIKRWYFIAADYAFGHALTNDAARFIRDAGGSVSGTSYYPFPSTDFAAYLLAAQASGAQAVAFASSGADLQTEIKQANEFGLTGNQQLVGMLMSLNNVHALGLDAVKGMRFAKSFYWDLDDESRAFARRFYDKMGRMPTAWQAGQYSAVLNYLRAVEKAGSDRVSDVMAALRTMPIHDAFARHAALRPDGQLSHDFYVVSVKAPKDSRGDWDYYHIDETVPGEDALMPLSESKCPLVRAAGG